MRFIINYTIIPLFYLTALPICIIIALMDSNNGKGFKKNLREVMGIKKIMNSKAKSMSYSKNRTKCSCSKS